MEYSKTRTRNVIVIDMTYPFKWRLNLVQMNAQGLIGFES